MTPAWQKITNGADSEYNAVPVYDAPYYGSDQLTEIGVGPCGVNDGSAHWTFSVSTNAPSGKFPGNRRYLAVRTDGGYAPHV